MIDFKILFTGVATLFVLSLFGNGFQCANPKIVRKTDTTTVYVEQSPLIIEREVEKLVYRYRTIDTTDTTTIDSLLIELEQARKEIAMGQIREYDETFAFEEGDTVKVKLKGVLFDKVRVSLFRAPIPITTVTNETKIYYDSRDNVWFSIAPAFGLKASSQSLIADADLMFLFRKAGLGVTASYNFSTNDFSKGIKFTKIWDIPKIKLIP